MEYLTALKLNIDKVLEFNRKQDEKLADIQKKMENSIASLTKRMDRIEENSSFGSFKIPRELSVWFYCFSLL